MKRSILLLITLLITSLIPLLGQTGEDTVTCYTNDELRRIANQVIYANECDTLLEIAYEEIIIQNNVIDNKNQIIDEQDSIIRFQDTSLVDCKTITEIKDSQLDERNRKIKKLERQNKWIKAAGIFLNTVLATTLVIILL